LRGFDSNAGLRFRQNALSKFSPEIRSNVRNPDFKIGKPHPNPELIGHETNVSVCLGWLMF
jgi:hypothetical protein